MCIPLRSKYAFFLQISGFFIQQKEQNIKYKILDLLNHLIKEHQNNKSVTVTIQRM